jgi:Raf kinase inhibitor-like YbhB/YbcL family protein
VANYKEQRGHLIKSNKVIWFIVLLLVIVAGVIILANRNRAGSKGAPNSDIPIHMDLTSSAFQFNQPIPLKYSCEGQGINPPLDISGTPRFAKSLALIVHDPDAPAKGGFTHWVIFNIAPTTTYVAENSVPQGAIQGMNDAGKNIYIGPCPPSGTHHYHFMLYALDTVLGLTPSTAKDTLIHAMQGHIIGQTDLIGTYQKSK